MKEREGIDEIFRGLSCFQGSPPAEFKIDDSVFGGLQQLEAEWVPEPDDEVILGEDYVTYIAFAPDCDLGWFSVSALKDCVEVTAGAFKARISLEVEVDEEGAMAEYRNGVLSVRLRRILPRNDGA